MYESVFENTSAQAVQNHEEVWAILVIAADSGSFSFSFSASSNTMMSTINLLFYLDRLTHVTSSPNSKL